MLHGEIKANDTVFATWEAVRGSKIINDLRWYNCKMNYRDSKGYPLEAEFEVRHRESDGALALAAVVIEQARWLLKPKPTP